MPGDKKQAILRMILRICEVRNNGGSRLAITKNALADVLDFKTGSTRFELALFAVTGRRVRPGYTTTPKLVGC